LLVFIIISVENRIQVANTNCCIGGVWGVGWVAGSGGRSRQGQAVAGSGRQWQAATRNGRQAVVVAARTAAGSGSDMTGQWQAVTGRGRAVAGQ